MSKNNFRNITQDEWKAKLSEEQYRILRQGATEPPFTGKYLANHEDGMYRCAACGAQLFSSKAKFDSGTGWPSFDSPANTKNIELRGDLSAGMARTEVICKNCGSHLGHLFGDGPVAITGKRYCINSCALEFEVLDNKDRGE